MVSKALTESWRGDWYWWIGAVIGLLFIGLVGPGNEGEVMRHLRGVLSVAIFFLGTVFFIDLLMIIARHLSASREWIAVGGLLFLLAVGFEFIGRVWPILLASLFSSFALVAGGALKRMMGRR